MLSDVGGREVSKCLDVQSLFFLIKENWICAMTRHHAKPNNILLTRNLPFGSSPSFGIGCPRSRGWKNFGRRWTRGVGCFENWTIFMDVICVSSLIRNIHFYFRKGWQNNRTINAFLNKGLNITNEGNFINEVLQVKQLLAIISTYSRAVFKTMSHTYDEVLLQKSITINC